MSTTRRKFFWGTAALPIAAAAETVSAAPRQELPRMYYVYAYNPALKDFEIIGAFSKRDEADAFLATVSLPSKGVWQWTWREVIDMMTTARLGEIAEVLRSREIEDLGIS